MKLLLVVVAVIVLSPGCSTYAASRYSISADNVRTLRTFKGQSVNVGAFSAATPGQTEIMCRGVGPIKTPDGEAFEHFMRKAFVDELTIAEIYSSDAPITITGRLDAIDFSSGIGATWNIALTVTSSKWAESVGLGRVQIHIELLRRDCVQSDGAGLYAGRSERGRQGYSTSELPGPTALNAVPCSRDATGAAQGPPSWLNDPRRRPSQRRLSHTASCR
jgi:hypothetical protein